MELQNVLQILKQHMSVSTLDDTKSQLSDGLNLRQE